MDICGPKRLGRGRSNSGFNGKLQMQTLEMMENVSDDLIWTRGGQE